MGFFSELKSDLSSAVNTISPKDEDEMSPAENHSETQESGMAEEVDLDSMLNRLDNIKLNDNFETEQEEKDNISDSEFVSETQQEKTTAAEEEPQSSYENTVQDDFTSEFGISFEKEETEEKAGDEVVQDAISALEAMQADSADRVDPVQEENRENHGGNDMMETLQAATDETASITGGMVINGDIQTTGSLDLLGKVVGNVTVYGKMNVNGEVEGDSTAAEVYAESARITGDIHSQGSVKIGQSTVIIGNIFANSAVIAGAIKGDIDVHGPVVLDTTAIVMGNIRSQSVQINNGAVIEGMCSQVYAEVNPSAFFEELRKK
ncbi:MAG: polymer-forming cytoskeletal protein [Butyrivibrio sp.]|nr:polymer-forming cytoskeletal protein [Butyrivibrio sp.]